MGQPPSEWPFGVCCFDWSATSRSGRVDDTFVELKDGGAGSQLILGGALLCTSGAVRVASERVLIFVLLASRRDRLSRKAQKGATSQRSQPSRMELGVGRVGVIQRVVHMVSGEHVQCIV